MSQEDFADYLNKAYSAGLLFVRRYVFVLCCLLFLYYSKGQCFYAAKTALSMIQFDKRRDYQIPMSAAENQAFQNLFSIEKIQLISLTLIAALLAMATGLFIVWLADQKEHYSSAMTTQQRRMRFRVEQEVKTLELEGRLIATLKTSQAREEAFKTHLKKMEDIVLRYEQMSMAPNSERIKRPKLSETEHSLGDLFDIIDAKASAKKPSKPSKPIKFKLKR